MGQSLIAARTTPTNSFNSTQKYELVVLSVLLLELCVVCHWEFGYKSVFSAFWALLVRVLHLKLDPALSVTFAYFVVSETKVLFLEKVDHMLAETSPRTSHGWKPHTTWAAEQDKVHESKKATDENLLWAKQHCFTLRKVSSSFLLSK
ncbi:hypothetical protein DFH08DRAFT_968947 [Mycena albidolilacea]|uniref:Uncharacterized protein n=1 Tax=Mycena albidolilacea TaxID=1033008 RepID=A0AAD6ZIE1_9AGAR|nr:hypothetical protein DFH08DRAFT_968947 [Mycena albidolilacea]